MLQVATVGDTMENGATTSCKDTGLDSRCKIEESMAILTVVLWRLAIVLSARLEG